MTLIFCPPNQTALNSPNAPYPSTKRLCESASAVTVSVMSDAEQAANIQSLGDLFLQAYARFEDHRNPADREEAYKWLRARNAAVLARVQEYGGCFFAEQGARDGLALRGGVV